MLTRQSGTKKLIAIMSLVLSLSCSATQAQKNSTTKPFVRSTTKEDSLQYAMGIYVGQWIRDNGFPSFDGPNFMAGLQDILTKKPTRFSDSISTRLLNEHRNAFQLAMTQQLEKSLFAAIADTPGIQTLSGGIKYQVRQQGSGARPSEKDSVLLGFKGVLINGTVFEDTYAKRMAVYTTPANLFPGLRTALLAMPAGSIWQLYIPAAMGYGDTGNGTNIPPGNPLIILLELAHVKKNP